MAEALTAVVQAQRTGARRHERAARSLRLHRHRACSGRCDRGQRPVARNKLRAYIWSRMHGRFFELNERHWL
jgi:hypothetical protein